jgi:ribose transport system substrate-binding protein
MTDRLLMTVAVLGALGAPTLAAADAHSMEVAMAILESHRAIPDFVPPGEPFDARACMADKKVLSIPVTMTVPFVEALQAAMARAAGEVGFEYTVWENPGSFDAWIQGVNQAIAQDYDIVDMAGGLNPELLGPQLIEAKAAGLTVTTTHLYDESQTPFDITDGSAKIPYRRAGEILAAWAYVETEGAPNVLIIGSDDVLPTGPFVAAMQEQLTALCPDCGQTYVNVPLAEWGTKIQESVQSAILADPTINYILPIYDSMSQFVIPGLRIAGAPDVPIASFNGTPFVLDLVREGNVSMVVGEGLGWAGYAAIDVQMRTLCGLPVPESLNVPLVIFDQSNIETVGVPANFDAGYGDAHLSGFRKLWMLE